MIVQWETDIEVKLHQEKKRWSKYYKQINSQVFELFLTNTVLPYLYEFSFGDIYKKNSKLRIQ